MKRYEFKYSAEAPAPASGGLLVGLALPYGVAASPQHPAFRRGALVEYDTTKPLLLEHDIRAAVGKVLKVWEEDDGVHFVAKLDAELPNPPKGLSVGGEYVVSETGDIEALMIYEISLTDSPAYKATNYTFIASMKAQESITELQALAQQLQELAAKVQELQAFVEQAQSQFEAMQTEIARLAEGYAAITEKLQQQDTAQMQASLQAFQERSQKVLDTLVESMSTLANIVAKQK